MAQRTASVGFFCARSPVAWRHANSAWALPFPPAAMRRNSAGATLFQKSSGRPSSSRPCAAPRSINVHYVYSFLKRPEGKSALVINAEDSDVAAQALNQRGFHALTQTDISR